MEQHCQDQDQRYKTTIEHENMGNGKILGLILIILGLYLLFVNGNILIGILVILGGLALRR